MNKIEIEQIEKIIGIKFNKKKILEQAFTHKSVSKAIEINNERLEFLGDRVLGLVISDILYENYKNESEGDLAKRLAVLVSGDILLKISKDLRIHNFIKVGAKVNFNGHNNKSILSDAMEALIGAVFLDSNYNIAREFIVNIWRDHIKNYKKPPKDSKSILQEWAAAHNYDNPIYLDYNKTGEDHNPSFSVKLKLDKFPIVSGKGNSKKDAEMDAAKNIMNLIEEEK